MSNKAIATTGSFHEVLVLVLNVPIQPKTPLGCSAVALENLKSVLHKFHGERLSFIPLSVSDLQFELIEVERTVGWIVTQVPSNIQLVRAERAKALKLGENT